MVIMIPIGSGVVWRSKVQGMRTGELGSDSGLMFVAFIVVVLAGAGPGRVIIHPLLIIARQRVSVD